MPDIDDAVKVRAAKPADFPAMVEILGLALPGGDFGEWLVWDDRDRLGVFPSFMAIMVKDCLEYGAPMVTEDLSAVALWYPHFDSERKPAHYDFHLKSACGPYTPRFQLLDAAFAEHHPTVDHDYLAFVGVRPKAQNRGLGTALLRAHLQELDRTGQPAFLYASSGDSRRLYVRLGFLAASVRHLPDDGPPYWACWRPGAK